MTNDGLTKISAAERERYQTRESVERLVQDVSPCPHDILWYIQNCNTFQGIVNNALHNICTIDRVLRLLDEADTDSNDSLILVQPNDRNEMCVSLKTVKIAASVLAKLGYLDNQSDAQSLFIAAPTNEGTRTLAGLVFKILAIQATRGQLPALESHGFHLMKALNGTAKFPSRFQHTLTTPTRYVARDRFRITSLTPPPV